MFVASLGITALFAVFLHPAWVSRALACFGKLWATWMAVLALHACAKQECNKIKMSRRQPAHFIFLVSLFFSLKKKKP